MPQDREDVIWSEAEIHHVDQHSQGGRTVLENDALVHRHRHPKGAAANRFANEWRQRMATTDSSGPSNEEIAAAEDAEENGEAV